MGLLVAQRLEKQTQQDLEKKEEVERVPFLLQSEASLLFQAPPSSEGTNLGHRNCSGSNSTEARDAHQFSVVTMAAIVHQ